LCIDRAARHVKSKILLKELVVAVGIPIKSQCRSRELSASFLE
jgi:hypothetical protein